MRNQFRAKPTTSKPQNQLRKVIINHCRRPIPTLPPSDLSSEYSHAKDGPAQEADERPTSANVIKSQTSGEQRPKWSQRPGRRRLERIYHQPTQESTSVFSSVLRFKRLVQQIIASSPLLSSVIGKSHAQSVRAES